MSLRKARAAVASSIEAEKAAEELMARGNALDGVVAGVFAAAAVSPGVLLGPVQILVGGAGSGLLAIDGRVRQPGIGAPRPRGFQTEDEIPDAARVGVPWLPAALSVALATMGTATFAQVLAPAIRFAKGTPRAELLQKIASRGPRAMEETPIGAELLATAGRPNGGLLTSEDLASPRPEVQKATRIDRPGSEGTATKIVHALPWARIEDEERIGAPAHPLDIARVRAVAAVDRNATFALACWDDPVEGLLIPELGLRAPFFAEPVRRGQTRTRPGDPRPAAGPLALVGTSASPLFAFAAFGASDAYDVLRQAIEAFVANGERIHARGGATLFALSHTNSTASILRN